MLTTTPIILVVGAAGRFAGLVVPELVRKGALVRAFVRSEAKAAIARENGASEIAIGDLHDTSSLENAMQRVDGVFHIGPAFVEDEAELGVRVVDAARRSGVRKIVFSSVIHPTNTSLATHASKLPVEEAIFRSGLEYTILHPATFFQNIAGGWPSVVERGTFVEPFPRTTRIARVDYRDVAEVAAIAFTTDRLAYGTFELAATMLDRLDIARVMSEVMGRHIGAGEAKFDDWAADLPMDGRQKELLGQIYDSYADYGSGGNRLTLGAILGREPRSLRGYIEDLAAT
jgi:uncharacterized protein YbjT (DUF2867 family)